MKKKKSTKKAVKQDKCSMNVGRTDRYIRIVLGLFLALGAYNYSSSLGNWNYLAYLIAFILIITGLRRKCALYCPLNINTNKKSKNIKRGIN